MADVNDGGQADPAKNWYTAAFRNSACGLLAFALLAVVIAIFQSHKHETPARLGLEVAAPVTAVLVILLGVLSPGVDKGGIVGYFVGHDKRLSTSKLQIVLWTVAIAFAFIFFSVELADGQKQGKMFDALGGGYLLLLGGPFAAAVLAKATTASQAAAGTLDQTAATQPDVKDLVNDNSDQPSVTDAQFLLFNLVALLYFGIALAKDPTQLPTLPDTLVGLTSVSAITYLGAKFVSGSTPSISSIGITQRAANSETLDGAVRAGDTLKIVGSGFGQTPTVLMNGTTVAAATVSDTTITVVVPSGLPPAAAVSITVQTDAGQISPANVSLSAPSS